MYDYNEKKSKMTRHRQFDSFAIKGCYQNGKKDSAEEGKDYCNTYCHALDT